jgi:uncharacterized membrane-anchored protein YhcB (DUF1043 family)
MTADVANPFNTYMNMVTAVAVTVGLVMGYFRDRRLEKSNAKVATEVVHVKDELNTSKEEVATHRENEKTVFGTIQAKLDKANETADKTHTIVNSQRTAILKKLVDSQLFTLTLAKAMLEDKPHSQHLKVAVTKAQALYDASVRDLEIKQQEN